MNNSNKIQIEKIKEKDKEKDKEKEINQKNLNFEAKIKKSKKISNKLILCKSAPSLHIPTGLSFECLILSTFLKFYPVESHLKIKTKCFDVSQSRISPTNEFPVLCLPNDTPICGLESIMKFFYEKTENLDQYNKLFNNENPEITEILIPMILHHTKRMFKYHFWFRLENFCGFLLPEFYASNDVYIQIIYPFSMRRNVVQEFQNTIFAKSSEQTFIKSLDSFFLLLSKKLGNQKYFCGNSPTLFDCVVFGSLAPILFSVVPNPQIPTLIREYKNLVDFCEMIKGDCFPNWFYDNSLKRKKQDKKMFPFLSFATITFDNISNLF
ncbi:metaxin related [Anaeramoeba ignava]|uniref:Metaxin related n=1 Tax=Anaeramoeba ignava TaxID=1746090 RepID=A0A9Q0LR80_ANAIG|nr:metaxin related [Anaeramoeba ignava]